MVLSGIAYKKYGFLKEPFFLYNKLSVYSLLNY